MIKKIKASLSEKLLLAFVLVLAIFTFGSFFSIKNKCLFVKKYDPKNLKFEKPKNIAVLNAPCGNVILELYPELAPNSVDRFRMLINKGEYDNVSFHRVIKDVLVQAGDLEFGKKNSLNYAYIGSGKSNYGTIDSEVDNKFDFKKGSVALARKDKKNT